MPEVVCPTCNRVLPDDSPYMAVEVQDAIKEVVAASEKSGRFLDEYEYWENPARHPLTLRGVQVTPMVVDEHDYDSDRNYSNYSEEIWVVVRIGEQFFKRSGTYASHSGHEWFAFAEVKPVTRTVQAYE